MKKIAHTNFLFLLIILVFLVAVNFGQNANQTKLTKNNPIETSIKAGETLDYFVQLKANEFIQIQLDQKGIDAILRLSSPEGKELIKRDSPNGENGAEIISHIAQFNGIYKVTVSVLAESETKSGNISIRIAAQRSVNSQDNLRIEAESFFQEGVDLVGQDDELSKKKYAESTIKWRQLKEKNWLLLALLGIYSAEALEEALIIYQEFKDVENSLNLSITLGKYYSGEKQFDKAFAHFERALSIAKEKKDIEKTGSIENQIAETKKAQILQKGEVAFTEGVKLNNLGVKQSLLAAIQKFSEAGEIFRSIEAKKDEATCLFWISGVYLSLGENQRALDYQFQSLTMRESISDENGKALNLNNIGLIYSILGERQKALDYFNQALVLMRKTGQKSGEARTLVNIGLIYDSLGEKQKAIDWYNQALPISQQANDSKGEAIVLNNIGYVFLSLGQKKDASERFIQALNLLRKIKELRGEAYALINIGSSISNINEAPIYFTQSLELMKKIGDKAGEAVALNNLGLFYLSIGENQKALAQFNESLPLMKQVGDKTGIARTLNHLMNLHSRLKQSKIAIYYGKQAVNQYQEIRADIKGFDKETQQTFLKTIEPTYRKLVELLLEEDRKEEALQVLSLFKEEEFFESYRQRNNRQSEIGLALTAHEKDARNRFNLIADKLTLLGSQVVELENIQTQTTAGKQQLTKLNADLKTESENFQQLQSKLADEFNKVTAQDNPPEIPEIRILQADLKRISNSSKTNAVAIYTLIGEEKYSVLLVTPNKITSRFTAIQRTEFLKKINNYREILQNPTREPKDSSAELYNIILKPIEKELSESGANTLMWSLDGQLRYLPVATLYDTTRKEFLLQRFRNALFTPASNSPFGEAKTTNQIWKGMGAGVSIRQVIPIYDKNRVFSSLLGALPEIRGIIKQPAESEGIYQGKRLENQQFSTESFKTELKNKYQLVHIASHFYFNEKSPIESFLVTGKEKETMSLSEMLETPKLFEGVELLTLSACQTAIGSADSTGKEIEGFAVLAQRQGAKAIMATLWKVDDDSSEQLMKDFYLIYNSSPQMNKAEALRQSQLKLLNEKSHPFYWSSFILIGNWQ